MVHPPLHDDAPGSTPSGQVPKKAIERSSGSHSEKRDTAEGCRDRAADDLRQADEMDTDAGRRMLERSAESWTARADQLERVEAGLEREGDALYLTAAEIAEDAAHVRD